VAVASRRRPVRLRWLLNALAEQDFPADRFEVVVAHDPTCAATAALLRSHALAATGQLRGVSFPPGNSLAAAGRNAAWQAADAAIILFTDDDCRPARDWITRALAAAGDDGRTVVQGRTIPDPDETVTLLGAPWTSTVLTSPPTPWAETCNIAYPRPLLEQLGGLESGMGMGEDTDLWLRARDAGARLVADPEMLVYHAVHATGLLRAVRSTSRWRDVAWLAKRHPEVRRDMSALVWWKREHAALTAAWLGVALSRRDRRAALAGLPWVILSLAHRGYTPRGIARSISELPGRALIDSAEMLTMIEGSMRHRTLLL
jgi:GT2 family glycosyltransferase